MQDITKLLARIVSEVFNPLEPVVEIGSLQVPGQEEYADLRPFFLGKPYVGIDMRGGVGVDMIADGERLPIRDATVGTVIILDTLEHVKQPWKVFENISQALKPDGMVIITSVMNFPIHDYPYDYWRFTPEGLKLLLERFPVRIIGAQGPKRHPSSVFGIGLNSRYSEWISTRFYEFKSQFLAQLPRQFTPDKTISVGRLPLSLLRYATGRKKVAHVSQQGDAYLDLFI